MSWYSFTHWSALSRAYALRLCREPRAQGLLAAVDARRPTRDIDLTASALGNTEAEILAVVREIADISSM